MVSVTEYLPGWYCYAWLVPAYMQCLLLHPRFPAAPTRRLRLCLTPLVCFLALSGQRECFTPRDVTRAMNIGFAFMSAFGAFKSIEWGTTGLDRSA